MSAEDALQILNEFVYSIDNLPAEVAFLLEEIAHKDERVQDLRHKNNKRDAAIQAHTKASGLQAVNPKEAGFVDRIRADQKKIAKLTDDKVALAERGVRLLHKHVARLDAEFERLKELGYNVGDAEAAAVAATAAAMGANNAAAAGMGMNGIMGAGVPGQWDLGSSNKKRKLPSGITTSSPAAGQGQTPLHSSNPYVHLQQGNPYAQQGTPTSMQSPVNAQYAASIGQYNPAALAQHQHQQQQSQHHQQQFQQVYQQQYNAALGQLQVQQQGGPGSPIGNLGNSQGAGGARPHRPSRLSSSFSATGAGPHTQILPTSAAAHLAPAHGGGVHPHGAGMQHNALNMSTSSAGGARKAGGARPIAPAGQIPAQSGTPASGQAGAARGQKKKKRIMISDEESAAGEEGGSEDAEGDADDGQDGAAVDAAVVPASRKGTASARGAGSRAGTPLSAASVGAGGQRKIAAAGAGQKGGQAFAARKKEGGKGVNLDEEMEEEDAEADAEGEEDWGAEGDETNADDPTLYCYCNRVSYGNMIACDNPGCKFEWFHWNCVGVTKQPNDNEKWFCPDCTAQRMQNKAGNKQQQQHQQQISGLSGAGGGGGSTAYQQLQAQQQQMMFAAQQAREGGRAGRRG